MTVSQIGSGAAFAATTASSGRFFLPGAGAFADTLSVGQIIQGRVLRGFEDNRYLVAFSGDERVVDSAVPLTAGEILYGRVVGLGDRVELQRVYSSPQHDDSIATKGLDSPLDAPVGSTIDNILQRYRVELSEADRAILTRAARAVDEPDAIGLAAAMLSKLGLPQSTALLDVLYRAQIADAAASTRASKLDVSALPQVLVSEQPGAQVTASSIRQLADLLIQITQDEHNGNASHFGATQSRNAAEVSAAAGEAGRRAQSDLFSDDESRRDAQDALAHHLLNAQTGGVVSHRWGLLPLMVGGRLVELSFALFEQRRPPEQLQGLQHRQVQFSIRTQRLGQVDVVARITGEHVRLHITTGSDTGTSQAARHADSLEGALLESGWRVDEVAYDTHAENPRNAVVRSVIEHVVSLDSLNRLV
jgi:hypothetical protein